MNFLNKTLSSFTGASFPYTIKDKIVDANPLDSNLTNSSAIWTVYDGTNPKADSAPVTVFDFNLKNPNVSRYERLARNAFKKLKVLRIPGIINAIDFIENDDHLYIVTEPVIPLLLYLQQHGDEINNTIKLYGLSEIIISLEFINSKANCIHGNLNLFNSVYVNPLGDWKLFGFEVLTNLLSDPDQPLYRLHGDLPYFWETLPDIFKLGQSLDISVVQSNPLRFDAYKLGQFIGQLFSASSSPKPSPQIEALQKSKNPAELCEVVTRLGSNSKFTAANALQKLDLLFNRKNKLVQLNKKLHDLKIMTEDEKLSFFTEALENYLTSDLQFPPGFIEHKLLPELLVQYQILSKIPPGQSNEGSDKSLLIVLNYILKFAKDLDDNAFKKSVKPLIMANFGLSNRAIRMIFLNYLPDYERHLSNYEVELKIFSEVVTGLYDSNFIVRETSLTSISVIIDKVSDKQINQELLRILAKSQMDPQPTIRVNTLVLIIKISSKIYKSSRNNVLITALSKSLRDTFTPCKMVALSGFKSLIDQFSLEEICTKILGQLAVSLMDSKSVKVRKEAKQVFEFYLAAVEKHASSLPEDEEEDEEQEVAEFYENAARKQKEEQESASQGGAGVGGFSLGWGVVNKLLASSETEGPMNRNFNPSTPDLTHTPKPTVEPTPITESTSTQGWDEEIDDDDGWGMDDEGSPEKIAAPVAKPVVRPPKISSLSLGKKPPTKKPINLAPKKKQDERKVGNVNSALKLNIPEDNDDDLDAWGDEW